MTIYFQKFWSRQNRNMSIKNPKYILDAQEKAFKKKVSHKQQSVQQNKDDKNIV